MKSSPHLRNSGDILPLSTRLSSRWPTSTTRRAAGFTSILSRTEKQEKRKKGFVDLYTDFDLSVRYCHTITNTNMTFVKGWVLQNPPGVWINLLNVSRPLSVSHCHCHCCLLLSTKLCCHYYNFYNCHSSAKYNRHKLNPTHQSRAPLSWSCYQLLFGKEKKIPHYTTETRFLLIHSLF